jgi:hypothetical protein
VAVTETVTSFELLAMRIESLKEISTGPGSLSAWLDVIRGSLTFRQIRLTDQSLLWEAQVSALGLEDVLVWTAKEDDVELVLRLRAVTVRGNVGEPMQPRTLLVIRMDADTALSFLSCLSFSLVKTSFYPSSENKTLKREMTLKLCSLVRKALARRDLINHGWSDDQLCRHDNLMTLLGRSEQSSWQETHLLKFSSCISVDAVQLRHHAKVGDADGTPIVPLPQPKPQRSLPAPGFVLGKGVLFQSPVIVSKPEIPEFFRIVPRNVPADDEKKSTYLAGEKPKVLLSLLNVVFCFFAQMFRKDCVPNVSQSNSSAFEDFGAKSEASSSVQKVRCVVCFAFFRFTKLFV